MNIGEAASKSGVSAKMIRYYESIGLIPAVARTDSGYRLYSPDDVHTLRFIRHARDLGFSVEQIGELLALWRDRSRASAAVKRLALEHVAALERKIHELRSMAETLKHLADHCRGDQRPHCPIIESLAETNRMIEANQVRPARFGKYSVSPSRSIRGTSRRNARTT
jgi:Cu(I)-responsive transcriptional regulator